MEKRQKRGTKILFRTGIKTTLLLLVTGAVLISVNALVQLLRIKEPFVDFSGRDSSTPPRVEQTTVGKRLRFAVAAMVSAEATFSTYRRLVHRICQEAGYQEVFVLHASYAEVRHDLEQGKVDVAFVCTGTYVHALPGKRIKLLVRPEFENDVQYRCLIIVAKESSFHALEDLRGAVMAFTDPESNTGCLVPTAILSKQGHNPETFFKKVVFTGSHDHSIESVALKYVDVAAVDSLVWYSKIQQQPSLAEQVRIIWESEPFGPPPIVVPRDLDENLEASLKQAFLALDKDEEGREILAGIGIKRFVPAQQEDYQTAIELYESLKRQEAVQ